MPQEFMMQGRIVRGHPCVRKPVLDDNKKPKLNDQGQPRESVYFGLAVEKNTFNAQYWPNFANEAAGAFPQGIPPSFAYKITDGDGIDGEGKPNNRHEGYAGHYVVNFSTEGFVPPVYKQEPNGSWRQLTAEEISCGDYAAVCTVLKYNGQSGSQRKPGLYVNPTGLIHIGYGQKIMTSSFDPNEKFANFQVQLPPGASATPLMNANAPLPSGMMGNGYAAAGQATHPGMMPNAGIAAPAQNNAPMPQPYGAPQQPQPHYAAPQQPMPGYAQPAAMPAPAHDFVNNAMGVQPQQPQMPGQAPQPYAPAQPQYPGQPPAAGGYAAPQMPGQAPQPYGTPQQPGMMPGMPPGR
jgi:hypothetical protein